MSGGVSLNAGVGSVYGVFMVQIMFIQTDKNYCPNTGRYLRTLSLIKNITLLIDWGVRNQFKQ